MPLFGVSFASVLFEILLTRIGANTLWYHYTHFVISMTALGFGFGAHFASTFEKKEKLFLKIPLLLAVLFPTSLALHLNISHAWDFLSLVFLLIEIGLFVFCFFLSGIYIASTLKKKFARFSTFYFVDLLGCALGSFCAGAFLFYVSALSLVFLCSTACLISYLFSQTTMTVPSKIIMWLLIFMTGLLVPLNQEAGLLTFRYTKSLSGNLLQTPEKEKLYEKWNPISRVSVVRDPRAADQLIILSDSGAPATLVRSDQNLESLNSNGFCNSFLHFYQKFFQGEVLILGSGGGAYVLCALENKMQKITAVEVNPGIVELVTKTTFADYIGNIFSHPQVELIQEDGRSYISRAKAKYNLIDLSLTASWIGGPASSYIFQENLLYTKEAFVDYINHLNDGGILSVTRYLSRGEALRVANTMLEAAKELNFQNLSQHFLVVRNNDKPARANVFFKKDGFSAKDIQEISQLYPASLAFRQIFPSSDADLSEQDKAFTDLFETKNSYDSHQLTENLINNYGININPTTDDKPFFFFTESISNYIFHPSKSSHPARKMAIYLLMVGTLFLFVVCAIYFAFLKSKKLLGAKRITYFSFIGTGFMFIEIPLLQCYNLLLGTPLYSLILILSVLIFSTGIGNLVSKFFTLNPRYFLRLSFLLVCLAGVLLSTLHFQFKLVSLDFNIRALFVILQLIMVGLIVGGFYPSGLRGLKVSPSSSSYCWAVNSFSTAFSASAAMLSSIIFGYTLTLSLGIFIYLGSCVLLGWWGVEGDCSMS